MANNLSIPTPLFADLGSMDLATIFGICLAWGAVLFSMFHCTEGQMGAYFKPPEIFLVFGAGFPPFRGGPLRYADSLELSRVESRLNALRAERGERFRPAERLVRLAANGSTFTG